MISSILCRLSVVLLLAAAATDAAGQGLSCRASQKDMLVADLMFGRNIGARHGVTERRWSRFLAEEITPRFPDGLTVLNAAGQYQEKNRIMRERTKLVTIIFAADAQAQEKIDAIVAAYKRQFLQQSVVVVIRPACVSF